ncbi:hypothetical protein HK096_011623, partial [Nowakowskiella sp. JEL0078]
VPCQEFLEAGKNREGYWDNQGLIKQMKERVFHSFEFLHPDVKGLFVFDNSQNRHSFPEDAVKYSKLNLGDGRKNFRKIQNSWFLRDG